MSDFPSPGSRRDNQDTSPTEEPRYPCTRWIVRILAVLLLVVTFVSTAEVISKWVTWNDHEAAAADVLEREGFAFEREGFWIYEWPRILLAGALAFAVLTIPVVAGLWRFRPGAWLAGVIYGVLWILGPLFVFLIWGTGGVTSLHAGYWVMWALLILALGFLFRRRTREVMGARPVVWLTPWLAVIVPWLAISLLIPAGVLALKGQLAREQGIPFWAASIVESLEFSHGELDGSEWVRVDLLDLSFPVPRDSRLIHFPAEKDPYSMVTLVAGAARADREVILLSGYSTLEMFPASVMEKLGTDDGMDFAREAMRANWSYWPLLYSHIILDERKRAFWLEDNERRVLAILSSGSSGERTRVRLSVQRESGSGIADVIYMLVPSEVETARIAAMAGWLHRRDSAAPGGISGNGGSGVTRELNLLDAYWEGNLDAGFELADELLSREERALHTISRLIDRLAEEAPTDSRLPDLKQRLAELQEE